jgi:prolyl oligopeptidase PreP (S9A serine peptidase family)
LSARRLEVLRENVECPSLSPDGTRLAYKRSMGGAENWRLHVLDLRTMRDVPLAERRSIDDQAEWLDDESIAYSLPSGASRSTAGSDIWTLKVTGDTPPRMLVSGGYSPVALR